MNKSAVVFFAIAMSSSSAARAGLFDDEVARKSVKDLAAQVEQQSKDNEARFLKHDESIRNLGITQLLNQLEQLNTDIARLRGQNEVLLNQLEQLQKRQKDFYLDIDTRLRKLEGPVPAAVVAPVANVPVSATPTVALASSASLSDASARDREARAYEVGIAAFGRGQFEAAISAQQKFVIDYPQSPLLPNAWYWIGIAQFNLKEFAVARATQEKLIKQYPNADKVPDAMLAIAAVQLELGDSGSARNTFEDIIAKYPMSEAATKARTRLAGLRR